MSKELIAKQDLERIAMQEIGSFPGCEHVTEVEIEYQVDKVLKPNWTIHVFTREGGNLSEGTKRFRRAFHHHAVIHQEWQEVAAATGICPICDAIVDPVCAACRWSGVVTLAR